MIRLLYAETVWRLPPAIVVFPLLVSNFDTFSRAQFFALARGWAGEEEGGGVYIGAYRIFWFRGAKRLSRFEFARAPTTGLSAIYFFIIVVVYRAIAPIPALSRLRINELVDSVLYTVILCAAQETLISHLYLRIVRTISRFGAVFAEHYGFFNKTSMAKWHMLVRSLARDISFTIVALICRLTIVNQSVNP